jgi:hypothetical protein
MTPAEILAVLRRMRALIATPETWTQGALALDRNGDKIDPRSDAAVCWCMRGAMDRCVPPQTETTGVYFAIDDRIPGLISEWNDTHTHGEVIAKLDEIIGELEAAA